MKKYEKVCKADYERWYRENQDYRDRVSRDPDRLAYHLMPQTGWLNDPNGLCQFQGEYHIYYQYTPFEPTGEIKLWGHYATRDFINYRDCGPVLFPDQEFDAHGVYSGSAFVEAGIIHYFYTGNVKYFDRADYDYIMTGRGSNTIHCTSRDGQHFSEKELLLTGMDYPADMSAHVRDPKIFKRDGRYYMALGARDACGRGMVLMYRSEDLKRWSYFNRITTKEPFGYMWECPDLFMLDGQLCLLCCPQGVEQRGVDFHNVHQCTIMKLDCDFENNACETDEVRDIRMVDRGFDFYAPQTFEDENGRRLLIGWMGIPDAEYDNPTVAAGWQHALTIPRLLHIRDGRLIQTPIPELEKLRGNRENYEFFPGQGFQRAKPGGDGSSAEGTSGLVYEAEVTFSSCTAMTMELRRGVTLSYEEEENCKERARGLLTLDMGPCGSGRTRRQVELDGLRSLRVYSDTSSLEIFVNGGEEVFTTRVYGHGERVSVSGRCEGMARLYDLGRFSYQEIGEQTKEL